MSTGLQLSRLDIKIKHNPQDKPLFAPLPDRHTSAFSWECVSLPAATPTPPALTSFPRKKERDSFGTC